MQVIDKKANPAVALHPLQLQHQLLICKMVAEKGRKDNIRVPTELNLSEIGLDKVDSHITFLLLGIGDAGFIDINPGEVYRQPLGPGPIPDRPKVIAPPTADFYHPKGNIGGPMAGQAAYPPAGDLMSSQEAVYSIQFLHVLPYIFKGNGVAVQQFLLNRPMLPVMHHNEL